MMSALQSWGCCNCEKLDEQELFIDCELCNKSFHFLCLCIPAIPSDSDIYRQWMCPGCRSLVLKSAKKDDTPVRNVSTARGSKRPALNSPPDSGAVTAEDVRLIVQDVIKSEFTAMLQQFNRTLVDTINKEIAPIKKDVEELMTSLTFHTREFEKLQSEHACAKSALKELQNENNLLKTTISDLSHRLNYLEQHTRSNNLEMQCLPENKAENLFSIVKQLGSVVGCNLKENDILHATRIAKVSSSSSRPRSIVVQLSCPRVRDQLLAAVMEYNRKNNKNKLNSADFGLGGDKTPVYIAEHLSPINKALHAATRIKAKEKGYKHVWVRNGRIFVKKSDDAGHILIRNMDTLNKL